MRGGWGRELSFLPSAKQLELALGRISQQVLNPRYAISQALC